MHNVGKPRSLNNPDDVFYADVQRPLGDDAIATASNLRPSAFPFEDHRRLCNAVLDSKADVLRSLLVDSELDANARSSTGATAGHQVGPVVASSYLLCRFHRLYILYHDHMYLSYHQGCCTRWAPGRYVWYREAGNPIQ